MNFRRFSRTHSRRRAQAGVSLVELMIAITLGLVAVGAAMSIFLANRKSFALVEGVARVQENARFAVDMLSRDLREAGGVACGGSLVQENVVNSNEWWKNWSSGLKGYDGATVLPAKSVGISAGDRVAGTDAFVVWSASTASPSTITGFSGGAGTPRTVTTFNVTPNQSLGEGYVFTACDGSRVATFTLNATASTSVATKEVLTNDMAIGGFVNQLNASAWYIGVGSRSSSAKSLYRVVLGMSSRSPATSSQEIVENITAMTVRYLVGDGAGAPAAASTSYVGAESVSDWSKVIAARISLTLTTQEKVGVTSSGTSEVINHTIPMTVAIRKRLL